MPPQVSLHCSPLRGPHGHGHTDQPAARRGSIGSEVDEPGAGVRNRDGYGYGRAGPEEASLSIDGVSSTGTGMSYGSSAGSETAYGSYRGDGVGERMEGMIEAPLADATHAAEGEDGELCSSAENMSISISPRASKSHMPMVDPTRLKRRHYDPAEEEQQHQYEDEENDGDLDDEDDEHEMMVGAMDDDFHDFS